MSADSWNIVCPNCDSINRIPQSRPAIEAKCSRCHRPIFTRTPLAVTAKNFETHVKRSDIPVLVDFWAEWCGPCKMMAAAVRTPVIASIEVATSIVTSTSMLGGGAAGRDQGTPGGRAAPSRPELPLDS